MSDEKQVRHYLNKETGLMEAEIVSEPHIVCQSKDPIFVLLGLSSHCSPMEFQSYYWTRELVSGGSSPPIIAYLPKSIERALVRPLEYDDSAWVMFNGKEWVITEIESHLIKPKKILPMDYSGSHRK